MFPPAFYLLFPDQHLKKEDRDLFNLLSFQWESESAAELLMQNIDRKDLSPMANRELNYLYEVFPGVFNSLYKKNSFWRGINDSPKKEFIEITKECLK